MDGGLLFFHQFAVTNALWLFQSEALGFVDLVLRVVASK